MATTKNTNNNESKKASNTSKSQNTKAAEKATANTPNESENKALIFCRRYADKANSQLVYWVVTFNKQAFYFYLPTKARRYMLNIKSKENGEIFNKDYNTLTEDINNIRKHLTGEQLTDFNNKSSKDYVSMYGKISAELLKPRTHNTKK